MMGGPERPDSQVDVRKDALRQDALRLLENWKQRVRNYQAGLLQGFLEQQSEVNPEIGKGWHHERGQEGNSGTIVVETWLQNRLTDVDDDLRRKYVAFRADLRDAGPPTLVDVLSVESAIWSDENHARFLNLLRGRVAAPPTPNDLENQIESLVQEVLAVKSPRRPRRPPPEPPSRIGKDAERRGENISAGGQGAPGGLVPPQRPPRRDLDKGKDREPLGGFEPIVPPPVPYWPPRPVQAPPSVPPKRRGEDKGKEREPLGGFEPIVPPPVPYWPPRPPQAPPSVPPKRRLRGDLRSRWIDLASAGVKAELKQVLGCAGGRQGGTGQVGFDNGVVRVCPAALLDSPEKMHVELVTGERVRAECRVIRDSSIQYALRYRRHGRARSSRFDLSAISRYTLVDLNCTVSFLRCTYWIPEIGQYLFAASGVQYFGLSDLRVAVVATRVIQASKFLQSLTLTFDSQMTETQTQTVDIAWDSQKTMVGQDEPSGKSGNFTLNPQTTGLSLDERSTAYFTVTRSGA
ncbi:hypothetical protein [Amycolatopsis sp. H20-H5]|uniref:hypothetical protein n=1 Tax=Amycolatopsis sp. H20-H5 TaxID=3046309 RepID=UPI002DB6D6AD|nr:hypothetical protein [Amycolatopsis sp. H20-H5]MEC3978744.1 hypothetical protein [Amycolatopsis sp. H20-H5]